MRTVVCVWVNTSFLVATVIVGIPGRPVEVYCWGLVGRWVCSVLFDVCLAAMVPCEQES